MNCHDFDTRYARQISLPEWGESGQKKLKEAKVLIIGAGGLGAPLLLYLAAAGIGKLGIIDADRVALSNLPRQILYENADIGRLKTEAAKDALYDRNPETEINLHTLRLDAENAEGLIAGYDIIADGSDNFVTRFAVNKACIAQKKALVSGAVIGFEGQLSVFKGYEADKPCYGCFIGDLPPEDTMPNCSSAGIMNSVAGMMACGMATETLKEIIGIGQSLAGYVLRYHALNAETHRSRLRKDKACKECGAA